MRQSYGPTSCPSPAAYSDRDHDRPNLSFKNATISRAKRSGAWAGWACWRMTLVCCPHDRTTLGQYHAGTTSLNQNHAQHTIRPDTTGDPHHEPSHHAGTTGLGTTSLAESARTSETGARNQNGIADHAAPAAQRVGHQLRRAPQRDLV